MDNHPIPQDVTGFQFRLIGDLTIKQFAYLIGSAILCWLSLEMPILIVAKLPIAVFFGIIGLTLAFIPISGRPADTMIFYFFKAVFSPTQYAYRPLPHPKQTTSVSPLPEQKKEQQKETKIHFDNPLPATPFAQQQSSVQQPIQQPTVAPMPPAPPTPPPPQQYTPSNSPELSKEAIVMAKQLVATQKDGTTSNQEAQEAHKKVNELESELQTAREQKRLLEERLLELQKQLSQKSQQVFSPSAAPKRATQNVHKVTPAQGKTIGAPLVGDVPNLISGIIKDPRGNVLPNILIEVKDKDNNPIRAFKTNPLGQFASATPVINGTYTISFEDPNGKQRFDSVEISATGEVLSPLEVISIDAREDLRKELFGG